MSNTPGTTHINPLVPISDQDRISPYNISDNIEQTSDENKEKYHLKGLLVDPIPNSQN